MSGYKRPCDEDYEYVVIDTGYVSRITKEGTCRQKFWEELGQEHNISLLFAFDNIWGTGLYKEGENVEEVEKLLNCCENAGIYHYGIACFRCSPKELCYLKSAVECYTYCSAHTIITMYLYESDKDDEPSIKYISWDAESG